MLSDAYSHGGEKEAFKRLKGRRSINAIRHKRRELRLGMNPIDCISTSEYARQMGTNVNALFRRIRNGSVKAVKRSGRWFIPIDVVTEVCGPRETPWDSITPMEAAVMVGVDESNVQRACASGYIDAVKIDGLWRVRKAHVEYAVLCMKRRGWVKMQWVKIRRLLSEDVEFRTLNRL